MTDLLLARRLANLAASLSLIAGIGALYALVPYYRDYFAARPPWLGERLSWWDVLLLATVVYVSLLAFHYLLEPSPRTSKSVYCLRALRRLVSSPAAVWRQGLPRDERVGLLSVLLKGFFAPLMVVWLFDHTAQLLAHSRDLLTALDDPYVDALTLFDAHGFWLLFNLETSVGRTRRVIGIEARDVNVHAPSRGRMSGRLPFLGSSRNGCWTTTPLRLRSGLWHWPMCCVPHADVSRSRQNRHGALPRISQSCP